MDKIDSYMKEQITFLINQVALLRPKAIEAGKQQEIDRIISQINAINVTRHTVTVCGEFKRGKSSFVNALLGHKYCAVSQDICTAVATVFHYEKQLSIKRYFGNFENIQSESIDIEELKRFTVGNSDEVKETLFVDIAIPLDILKAFTIIDTPGIGGLNPRHAYITNSFLPKSDLVLFLGDVNEPITAGELDYLSDNICEYTGNVAVILNKSDLKPLDKVIEIAEDISKKVENRIKRKINIVHVSTMKKNRYDKTGNNVYLEDSNFQKITELLIKLVNTERMRRLKCIQSEISVMMEYFIKIQQARLSAVEIPAENTVLALTLKQEKIEQRCKELSNPNSELIRGITKKIMSVRNKVIERVREQSILLSTTKFNKLLENPKAQCDGGGEWVGKKLNNAFSCLGANISAEINKAFLEISEFPEMQGFLDYKITDLKGRIDVKSPEIEDDLMDIITGTVMPSCGVGSVSFMGLGAIGLSAIALPAAVCAGVLMLIGKKIAMGKQKQIMVLRQEYMPQIQIETQRLTSAIEKAFQDFQNMLMDIIHNQLIASQSELEMLKVEVLKTDAIFRGMKNKKTVLESSIKAMKEQKHKVDILFVS